MNTLDRALYRGKRVDTGEWVYGNLLVSDSDKVCICNPHENLFYVESKTAGQFTGLTDKNGVKAFENDTIVDEGGNSSVIKWSDIQAGFYADDGFEEHDLAGDWFTVEASK